eukprot:8425903-Pyramimonas_sp.AAC.1
MTLGVGLAPGQGLRARRARARRRDRFHQMRVRKRTLQHYRKKLPRDKGRMTKIFIAGVRPAASFGAVVLWISDKELTQLRFVLMSGVAPAHRGASLA